MVRMRFRQERLWLLAVLFEKSYLSRGLNAYPPFFADDVASDRGDQHRGAGQQEPVHSCPNRFLSGPIDRQDQSGCPEQGPAQAVLDSAPQGRCRWLCIALSANVSIQTKPAAMIACAGIACGAGAKCRLLRLCAALLSCRCFERACKRPGHCFRCQAPIIIITISCQSHNALRSCSQSYPTVGASYR